MHTEKSLGRLKKADLIRLLLEQQAQLEQPSKDSSLVVPATLIKESNGSKIYKVGSQSDAGKLWNQLTNKLGMNARYKRGKTSDYWYVRCW